MFPSIISFLSLLLLIIPASALNVYVRPNDEQCFHEDVRRGEKVLSSYNVADGGFLDIDVKMYGPDTKIVYEVERDREGRFQFVAVESGSYRLCFGNAMSTVTGKTVQFQLYVGNSLAQQDAAKSEHITPLENSVLSLSEGLHAVQDAQHYIKFREKICASTNDVTNSRIVWWSTFKLLLLVATAAFQVIWLRRFFEKTKGV